MLKGIYSAAAGMTSQMVQTDAIADNLANINTPGFKQSNVQFQTFGDALVSRISKDGQTPMGHFAQGSQVRRTMINFTQGDLMQTGNPLDVAMMGDGFFTVRDSNTNATLYTRAGSFTRDAEGYITTPDGSRVQGEGGDIQIPNTAREIKVSGAGDVVVDGNVIGRLQIAAFQDDQVLKRVGNNFYTTEQAPDGDASKVSVEQGSLERSNANVITELVNNITGMRVYETLQKSIQMQSETLSKSVNEVGKAL